MKDLHQNVKEEYIQLWGNAPTLVLRANGRANIIGEHTDYHLGYVFPFAINRGIVFAASIASELEIHSLDYKDELNTLDNYPQGTWQSYMCSALVKLSEIAKQPINLKMVFAGDLPIGAGVSSSSALCCGVIELVNVLYKLNLENIQKVNLASEIEHGAGVQGGKMDQYSIFFGKESQAILMDCKSMTNEVETIPQDWSFLLINTLVKHNLVHTEYNTRRKEGEEGLQIIRKKYRDINYGRDLTLDILDDCKSDLTPIQYDRLKHVVTENERVLQFRDAMTKADVTTCGNLLNDSHISLRDRYAVSCQELDYLQELALESSFIFGARMMGGGFGGCTINLVKEVSQEKLDEIKNKFQSKFNYLPEIYAVSPSNGISFYE
jgi:galactokinase